MSGGYLLDTSILSLLAPGRPPIPQPVDQWLRARDNQLLISVVTLAELEQGIAKLRRSGGAGRAQNYDQWLENVVGYHAGRVLPIDVETSRLAGALSDRATAMGRHPGWADIFIAATAMAQEATLLTRNVRHFAPLGVDLFDPLTL